VLVNEGVSFNLELVRVFQPWIGRVELLGADVAH
jgi:hypothetical protein